MAAFFPIILIFVAIFLSAYGFMPTETLRDFFNTGLGETWVIKYTNNRHDAMSLRLWTVSGLMTLAAWGFWISREYVNSFMARFSKDAYFLWHDAKTSAKNSFFGGNISTNINLFILIMVGSALRIWFLDVPMSYDEGSTFYAAKQPLLLMLTNQWGIYHSTANWGVRLTTWIFGDAAWAVRLSMLITGIALIPMTFWAATIWSNHTVAGLAAAGVAISWPLLAYSVSARGYSFGTIIFVFLIALTPYLARTRNLAAAGVFAGAMAFSVYSVQSMVFPSIGLVVFMGGIILTDRSEPFISKFRSALLTCSIVGIGGATITFVLYSPYIIAHGISGLIMSQSVLDGDQPLPFFTLVASQMSNTLRTWVIDLPGPVQLIFGSGFVLGLLVKRWTSGLFVSLIFGIIPIFFIIGEFAPPPRIWQFLLPVVLLVAAVGLVRMISELLPVRAVNPVVVVLCLVITFWTGINALRSESVIAHLVGRADPSFYKAAHAVTPHVDSGNIILGSIVSDPGGRYEVDMQLAKRGLRLAPYQTVFSNTFIVFRACPVNANCPEHLPFSVNYIGAQNGAVSIEQVLTLFGIEDVSALDKKTVFETKQYLVQKISALK